MKNSKQHLTDAFSSLQDAQINLRHALDNSEKLNNTERIKSTLSLVNEALDNKEKNSILITKTLMIEKNKYLKLKA